MRRRNGAWVCGVFAALVGARTASAQTAPTPAIRDEARRHFQSGVNLSAEQNYAAAVEEFTHAFALTGNPAVLFNLSAAQELAGRFVDARTSLERYRAATPELPPTRRAEVEAARARLATRIGTLLLTGDVPDDLEVRVDAEPVRVADVRAGVAVSEGAHVVAMQARGFVPLQSTVHVVGERVATVAVALVPLPSYLRLTSDVPGAEVRVDGVARGTTPLAAALEVPTGTHAIDVERAGYAPFHATTRVAGPGADVAAHLAWSDPIAPEVGARLVVRVAVAHAEARLDGHAIALDGSQLVPPGHHRLRVTRDDFVPATREVDLPAGALTVVPVPLLAGEVFRARYEADVQSRQLASNVLLIAGAPVFVGGAIWLAIAVANYLPAARAYYPVNDAYTACRPGSGCTTGGQLAVELGQVAPPFNAASTMLTLSSIVTGVGLVATITGLVIRAITPPLHRYATPLTRLRLSPTGAAIDF